MFEVLVSFFDGPKEKEKFFKKGSKVDFSEVDAKRFLKEGLVKKAEALKKSEPKRKDKKDKKGK